MDTQLMTDPQAPYGTPPADDLTARVALIIQVWASLLSRPGRQLRRTNTRPAGTGREGKTWT